MMTGVRWRQAAALCSVFLFLRPALAVEPTIPLPKSAVPYSVGDNIVLNGLPIRMQGFSSTQSVDALIKWFTRSLGSPVVENRLGNVVILGKAVDGYYLTIQLEPGRDGVRGVTAVSNLKAADERGAGYRERSERWLRGLPGGSRIVSDMISEDRGKQSRQVVIENTQDEAINSRRIQEVLAEEGFVLEREALADDGPQQRPAKDLSAARTLYFKGDGKEAMATVARDRSRTTVIVINAISSLGRYP